MTYIFLNYSQLGGGGNLLLNAWGMEWIKHTEKSNITDCNILQEHSLCSGLHCAILRSYNRGHAVVTTIDLHNWTFEHTNQGFEFHFGDRFGLTIGTEYSGTSVFRCTISELRTGYIYTHMYIIYIFIISYFIISN